MHSLSRLCLYRVHESGRKNFTAKKVPEKFQIRVDKTNCVWYSVLATRLDKPNRLKRVAPEQQRYLQCFCAKLKVCVAFIAAQTPIPPFHSLFQKETAAWFALRLPPRIRCDWYRIACKENKNGTCSLTTCTPRFLFSIEKERFIPRSPQAPDTALRPRRRNI